MQPSLNSDEYVLVDKTTYLFHSPERGDVIVFHYPKDTTKDLIKRVIGLPGDTITIDNTTVKVDGILLKELYISRSANPLGGIWIVPPDQYFVMGDNRPASDDSRIWGFVPKTYIIGKALIIYWPFKNWQLINTYQAVFTQIK